MASKPCSVDPVLVIGIVINELKAFDKANLKDAQGNPAPFDLQDFVTKFYAERLKGTNNIGMATSATQMVPKAIKSALTYLTIEKNNKLVDRLESKGVDRAAVNTLITEFEDINAVGNYVVGVDPAIQAAAIANANTHPAPKQGRPSKNAILNRTLWSILEDAQGFVAAPWSHLLTTGQEAFEAVINPSTGKKEYDNVKDPAKKPMYNTLKALLTAFQGAQVSDGSTLKYSGHTGFKLAASVATNDKSLMQSDYVLTITDNNGAPLLFDENGKIDAVNGRQMYYSLRPNNEKVNSQIIHSYVDTYTNKINRELSAGKITAKEAKTAIAKFKEEFTALRKEQFDTTEGIINTIKNSPGKVVMLNITGGSKGYINESLNPLSKVWDKLSKEEKDSIQVDDTTTGFTYITLNNVQGPVQLQATPIPFNTELMESIINVLTQPVKKGGVLLNGYDKKAYVKQFINNAKGKFNIGVNPITGEVILMIYGTTVNVNDKNAGKILKDMFTNPKLMFKDEKKQLYVNINNRLIKSKTYDFFNVNAGVVTVETKDYVEDLLLSYLQIKAQPNAEGEIHALNGYLKWELSEEGVVAKEELPENRKAAEVTSKVIESNPDDLDTNRLILGMGTAAENAAADLWWKSSPLAKVIPLHVLRNIANSNAWASWNLAGITLYNGSDNTHIYHEAWHAFSQLYLTVAQKKSLYAEVAKQTGSFKVVVKKFNADGVKTEVLQSVDFNKATPRQLEEYIAEEFRAFAKSAGTASVRGSVKRNIFQRIWDAIKAFFSGVRTTDVVTQPDSINVMTEIFNKLYKGDVNDYSPSADNAIFHSANSGIVKVEEVIVGEGQLNYAESKLLVDSIDGLVSEYITKTGKAYSTPRIFLTVRNRDKVFDSVKIKMHTRLGVLTAELEANEKLTAEDPNKWTEQLKQLKERDIDIINYGLNNWGDHNNQKDETGVMGFYKEHSSFSELMKAPILKDDDSVGVDSDEKDLNNSSRRDNRAGNDVSSKELADKLVLYVVRSLIDVNPGGDFVMNSLGFPKLASFSITWNSLVRTVSGSSSIEELNNKLVDLSQTGHPIFSQLLEKLGSPELQLISKNGNIESVKTESEKDLWLKFWQAFNKPRIPINSFIVNKDANGMLTYKVGRASAEYQKIVSKWASNFLSSNEESDYIDKSANNINTLKLDAVIEEFVESVPIKAKNEIRYKVKAGRHFDFLKAIGIKLTDNEAIRKEVETTSIVNHIADTLALYNNNSTLAPITNPIAILKDSFKGLRLQPNAKEGVLVNVPNVASRVNELAELEAELSDEYSSLSRVTASGDRQFEQSLNSTMTGITDALNKVEKFQDLYTDPMWQHMEYLDPLNNTNSQVSVILNSLFVLDINPTKPGWGERRKDSKGNPNTINMNNLSGAMIIDYDYSDRGVAQSGMNLTDKFITDLHSVLDGGFFGQPQHGSKQSYFSTKLSTAYTYADKTQNHLYVSSSDFLPVKGSTYVKGSAEALKIVKRYIQAEVLRIDMVKNDPFYNTVVGFDNAAKFTLFDNNMLSKRVKAALLKDDFIAAVKASPNGITGVLESPEYAELNTNIKDGFTTYFKKLEADYSNNILAQTNVYYKDEFLHDAIQPKIYQDILKASGNYTDAQIAEMTAVEKVNKPAPAARFEEEEESFNKKPKVYEYKYKNPALIANLKTAAMRSFAVNSWIHKVEMMTLFYGDAFQYNHTKEEFNKRNSTFASSGDIFATDRIALAYVNSSKNIKGQLDYMRSYAATLEKSPVREFDGTFNTAILKDNNVRTAYYETLGKLFIANMKADNPKISNKEINEELYGKDGTSAKPTGGKMANYNKMTEGDGQGWVSFDAYRILKKIESKWSPAQENAYQRVIAGETLSADDIVEFFPVYKVQHAGNLKNTRGVPTVPITAIHKFALYPMIPTVIQNSPLDAIHKQMIKEGVDYALFQSGSKLSSITSNDKKEADSIFKGNNTSDLEFAPGKDGNVFTKNTIFLRNLKNQLDLNTDYKGKTIFSTQLRGLLNSGLIEQGIPVDYKKGEDFNKRYIAWNKMSEAKQMESSDMFKLSRSFENRMSRLVQLNVEKLVKSLGWSWSSEDVNTRVPVGPLEPMRDYIRSELTKQGFAKHEIDFIDVDAKGNLVRDVSSSFSGPQIERLLMSIINNRIIKQNMTGEALVQVAVSFTQDNKFTKPTDEQEALYGFGTSGLPFYMPDTSGKGEATKASKVKIALQGNFKNLFQTTYFKKNDKGGYVPDGTIAVWDTTPATATTKFKRELNFEKSRLRLNEMLRVEEWLNIDENRKKVTLTGVRIPVQGLNSMEYMEVYEFLPPIAGSIIILPSEIVAKSGGDFDVDKLTTYFPHITRNGTLISGDKFKSNGWEKDIDAEMAKIDAKIQKSFGSILGSESLAKIKATLKDKKKDHTEALTALTARKELADAKAQSSFEDIKAGFIEYFRTSPVRIDIKKAIDNKDNDALLQVLDNYESLDGLKNKGNGIHEAYKAIKALGLDEIDAIFEELHKDQIDLTNIKKNAEYKKLLGEYTDLQDQKKHFIASVQNDLITDMVSILSLHHNAAPLLTPNDTHLVKPISRTLESQVQSFDFKASRMAGEDRESVGGISPSRVFEEDYNLKKHQDNLAGMGSLGIVAIDNKYNPIFDAAGAHLLPTFKTTSGKVIPVNVFLKTNKMPFMKDKKVVLDKGKQVEVISLSALKDKDGKNSIAEIKSQLVNGYVDVEKDAWVAFIQGNKEVTPMLLFLNKMGVPIEDAIYFVSNPLTRKYINARKLSNGILGDLMSAPYIEEQIKHRARVETYPDVLPGGEKRYELMNTLLEGGKTLSLDNMKKLVSSKNESSNLAKGSFLHYIYLEDMMRGYDDIKAKTNVDTKKVPSLHEAQLRAEKVKELYDSESMPSSIINYIEKNSSISGFFLKDFASQLWGKLFPLRNNNVKNAYLNKILANYSQIKAIEKQTGYSKERFITEFDNNFISFIFTNQIKDVEAGKSEYYKGIRTSKTPIKYAEGINKAAFVKKGKTKPVIHINIKNIEQEFNNAAYLATAKGPTGYITQGLAPVDAGAFANSQSGRKEYENFVVEREYLRYSYPINTLSTNAEFNQQVMALVNEPEQSGENQTQYEARIKKTAYENFLRDKALDNTFNFYKLFKAGEASYPKRMMKLLSDYPLLKEKYPVLKQFAIRAPKKGGEYDANHMNLLLTDARDLDQDSTTQYYNDIKSLSKDAVLIAQDKKSAKKVGEENKFINEFFKRLSLFGFMQSGLSYGSETAFNKILPYDDYARIVSEGMKKINDQLQWKKLSDSQIAEFENSKKHITRVDDKGVTYGADIGILNQFLVQFKTNNDTTNKSTRVAGIDWTQKATPNVLRDSQSGLTTIDNSPFIFPTATRGVFTLSKEANVNTGKTDDEGNPILIKRPLIYKELKDIIDMNADNAYFVFNSPAEKENPYGGISITDKDTEEQVAEKIAMIEAQFTAGKKIVFMEGGYAQALIEETQMNAPEVVVQSNAEFDEADKLTPIEQNFTDGQGGRKMQDVFKGKSTMDLIISGDRTRTTRANTDIQRMAKDYGLSKISDLVGKVIRMTDKTGRQVYTRITKVTPFTQQYQDQTWQKEGWEKSVTDKHVGQYPYAIEFEVVNKPTQVQSAILPTDKIIFGHPTIGKSFLKKQGGSDFISLDDDYSTEINKAVEVIATKYKVTTYQVKDGGSQKWNSEYDAMMQRMFDVARKRAVSENKTLFTSNTNLLRNNTESFDKVINLTDEEFEKRIQKRGAKYDTKQWKAQINEAISKIPSSKVITTDKYLSDLLPTQVQSQLNAAPKSEFFRSLSTQLADKFGYINPGSEVEVDILDILSKQQMISQQDINNAEENCK